MKIFLFFFFWKAIKIAGSAQEMRVGRVSGNTGILFMPYCDSIYWSGHAKTCLMPYANNKGADQPAHSRSLISTFIVRCLDSIVYLVSISEMSSLSQAGLSLIWSKI